MSRAARPGRGRCTAATGRGWSGHSSSSPRRMLAISRNLLLVSNCECRLRADTRDQPPTAAKGAPGSPEGAAHGPHRPGRHRSRAHDDRGAAHYPAADVTAGRGFPGPGTLGPGLLSIAASGTRAPLGMSMDVYRGEDGGYHVEAD